MRLSHHLEYFALRAFAWLLCVLPRGTALSLGAGLGKLGWMTGLRRELVLTNLEKARPWASRDERKRVGARAATSFGRTVAEFVRYGIKDRDRVPGLVDIEGIDKLKAALREGKGAIVLTGHLGSWAIYFAAIAMRDVPLALLVGKQHNPKVDEFIHRIPGDRVEFISKGRAAVKTILGKLQSGRAVVMVADQHAGKGGIMSPFLGCLTPTLALPGSLAVKYDAPVFTMAGRRLPNGRHRVIIDRLQIEPGHTPEAQKSEIIHAYNIWMGEQVREFPDQYFWYHRRWRPEDHCSAPAPREQSQSPSRPGAPASDQETRMAKS